MLDADRWAPADSGCDFRKAAGEAARFPASYRNGKAAHYRLHAKGMIYNTSNSDQLYETLKLDTGISQGCDSRENFVNKSDFVNILDARRFQ
jgi:hypothetical protein